MSPPDDRFSKHRHFCNSDGVGAALAHSCCNNNNNSRNSSSRSRSRSWGVYRRHRHCKSHCTSGDCHSLIYNSSKSILSCKIKFKISTKIRINNRIFRARRISHRFSSTPSNNNAITNISTSEFIKIINLCSNLRRLSSAQNPHSLSQTWSIQTPARRCSSRYRRLPQPLLKLVVAPAAPPIWVWV